MNNGILNKNWGLVNQPEKDNFLNYNYEKYNQTMRKDGWNNEIFS